MAAARALVVCLEAYLAAGVVAGVAFLWRGLGRVDPAARGGPLSFRLVILPGCVLLWPFVLARWLRPRGSP
jgi:hypothetical protein